VPLAATCRDGMDARLAPSHVPLGGLATAPLYPMGVILSTISSGLEVGQLLVGVDKVLRLAALRHGVLALPRERQDAVPGGFNG
jgi:hypothetical protein